MLNHQLVTLGQFIELAQPIINIGLVPLAVGQAGAGKTESGYKIAEIMGYDYVLKINPNTMEITDLHGTPAHAECEETQTNVTDWYAPKHWVNLMNCCRLTIIRQNSYPSFSWREWQEICNYQKKQLL